jgi:hypothetical protein
LQKISAVKKAWYNCHESGLLSNDMFEFGIEMLKLENNITDEKLLEVR